MSVSSQHHSQHHYTKELHIPHPRWRFFVGYRGLQKQFPLSAAPWDQGAIRDKTPGPYGRSFLRFFFFFFLRATGSECSPASREKKHIYKCDEKNCTGVMVSLS